MTTGRLRVRSFPERVRVVCAGVRDMAGRELDEGRLRGEYDFHGEIPWVMGEARDGAEGEGHADTAGMWAATEVAVVVALATAEAVARPVIRPSGGDEEGPRITT